MKQDSDAVRRLVEPLTAYARRVLTLCADPLDPESPLLADRADVAAGRPARLLAENGGELVLCNVAGQVGFIRLLQGLTVLTGEAGWKARALAMLRYVLRRPRRNMLLWGNHAAIDLLSRKPVFLGIKGKVHELKAHYPPYGLMWEADADATAAFVAGFWHGHMYDWSILDVSRHGRMDLPERPLPPDPWGADYVGGPPFFIGGGLTFLNAGSDLYLAAGELARLSGGEAPLRWALRLAARYDQTRHPRTGLSGYQYSCIFDKRDPDRRRNGDRAHLQLVDQFPEHDPLEGRLFGAGAMRMVAGASALCRFHLARALGPAGAFFARTATDDCEAAAAWSYDMGNNAFHPLFTDGFRLTSHVIERDGYYGPAGRRFTPRSGDGFMAWSFLTAWRVSGSPLLWAAARRMAEADGLGDIGVRPGAAPRLEPARVALQTAYAFALLELDAAFPDGAYRGAATVLAERLLVAARPDGFFGNRHDPAPAIGRTEPLAVLHVAARLAGMDGALSPFFSHSGLEPLTGWVREDDAIALA